MDLTTKIIQATNGIYYNRLLFFSGLEVQKSLRDGKRLKSERNTLLKQYEEENGKPYPGNDYNPTKWDALNFLNQEEQRLTERLNRNTSLLLSATEKRDKLYYKDEISDIRKELTHVFRTQHEFKQKHQIEEAFLNGFKKY